MNKKVLTIIGLVALVAILATGAFAYFTTSAGATGTITAGTVNMKIASVVPSADCPAYADIDDTSVVLWTDTNWAPGDSKTAKLCFTNTGSLAIPQVGFRWNGLTGNLAEHIFVTSIVDSLSGEEIAGYIAAYDFNHDGFMSLAELGVANSGEQEFFVYWGGVPNFLPVGTDVSWVQYTLKFDENAGNDLQGATFDFNLQLTGYQHAPY